MLRRILVIRSSSIAADGDFLAKLEKLCTILARIAPRAWPGARVETLDSDRPDKLHGLVLDAQDLLLVRAGDTETLAWVDDAAKTDAEAPAVVLLTLDETAAPPAREGSVVHGALRLDESAPESITLAVNNALASRVKAAFLRRLNLRSAPPGAAAAAPAGAAQAGPHEWLPTQVVARAGDGQFVHTPQPSKAPQADSILRDFGAKAPGYNIISHLASGGVAEVFLAERIENGNAAVLKIIDRARCDDQSAVKRFIQEYTLISRIRNPNVVEIFDRGFTPAYAFISMEYFPGGDLARRIRAGIETASVVSYTRQIANGLFEIHRHGIVHRDLKPGNVLFREDDSAAITDFGIAKLTTSTTTLTLDNTLMGTPYYIAPELVLGHPCDIASDLYSLGVVFFEMLTGNKPYSGKNLPEILSATLSAPIPALVGSLGRFQSILDRLMAKKPAERFRGAGELIEALSAPSLLHAR